jgi:hypothetical protein
VLGDAESSLSDAKSSLGDAKSSLGDAESSLSDAKSSLGDAKSSLGDAKSSLGDGKSSLGDAKSSLGGANISQVTHVVLSSNQRHLFAATATGLVRMYKYPLTGEFQELQVHLVPPGASESYPCPSNLRRNPWAWGVWGQAHVKPISRLCISNDDTLLFTVSDDGTLAVHSIRFAPRRAALFSCGGFVVGVTLKWRVC